VQRIVCDAGRLWVHDDTSLLIVDPPTGSATAWTAPPGMRIVGVDPASAIVLVAGREEEASTPIGCFELIDQRP
jgi:hypothetical protein